MNPNYKVEDTERASMCESSVRTIGTEQRRIGDSLFCRACRFTHPMLAPIPITVVEFILVVEICCDVTTVIPCHFVNIVLSCSDELVLAVSMKS